MSDESIAAVVGAAVAGAAAGIVGLVKRKKRRSDPPEPENLGGLRSRVASQSHQLEDMRREIMQLKHDVAAKVDKLCESVDQLGADFAKVAAAMPFVREQIDDLKERLRDELADIKQDLRGRRAPTHPGG